jgi:hypothetical protein
MASPLLDTVKQNAAAMATPSSPQGAATGLQPTGGTQTEQLAKLTATAQTGKEQQPAMGGQARLSAIGEKLANIQTLTGAAAIQQQGLMQSDAQAQQEQIQQQQYAAQATQISQQRLDVMASFNNQVKGMYQQQASELQQLHTQDDKSRAEQMGTLLRLGDEQYITQLNDAATKSRLDNQVNFQAALNQSVFANETSLMSTNLQFRNYMGSDARSAAQQLNNMDLDFALQIARQDNKAASTRALWSGAGSMVAGAVTAGMAAGAGGAGATITQASSSDVADYEPQSNVGAEATYQPAVNEYVSPGGNLPAGEVPNA